MIRPATLSDLNTLLEIENECFDADAFNRSQFRYLLTKAQSRFLVYDTPDGIAGYIVSLTPKSRKTARVYSMAVRPVFQSQGIAGQLLTYTESEYRKAGYTALTLEVRQENKGAIALYQRHGFRVTKTLRDYYALGEHGFKMTAVLTGKETLRSI